MRKLEIREHAISTREPFVQFSSLFKVMKGLVGWGKEEVCAERIQEREKSPS